MCRSGRTGIAKRFLDFPKVTPRRGEFSCRVRSFAIAALALAPLFSVDITGAGRVDGGPIACHKQAGEKPGGVCSVPMPESCPPAGCRSLSLTARPAPGFAFDHWAGACAGTDPACSVAPASSDIGATAAFRDVEAPVVSLALPDVFTGPVPVFADVSDNGVIDRVEFSFRGEVKLVDRAAPYGGVFPSATVADGPATMAAVAYDKAGNAAEARADVTIANAAPAVAPPVVAAPPAVAAPVPAPSIEQIEVALRFKFTSGQRATKLARFRLSHVPAGATVSVECPAGCAKQRYRKTSKRGGRLMLTPLVRRKLPTGTRITVTVSRPGMSSAVKVLTIRARKAPLVTTLCQPPGSPEPTAC
jgi:hypothetical protein